MITPKSRHFGDHYDLWRSGLHTGSAFQAPDYGDDGVIFHMRRANQSDGAIVDWQFNARGRELDAEQRLQVAVLEDAVMVWQHPKSEQQRAEVQAWFDDPGSDYAFSFRGICETLSIHPDFFLKLLQSAPIPPPRKAHFTPRPKRKLAERARIAELLDTDLTQREISKILGCSDSFVWLVGRQERGLEYMEARKRRMQSAQIRKRRRQAKAG